MIRAILLLRSMRSVRRLSVVLALVLATGGMVLVGHSASLILIGSGAYDAALPDDVVIVEDGHEPGTGVLTRILDSSAPAGTALPVTIVQEGESVTGVMTRMPDRGALAGMAQPVPVTQESVSVVGVMTRLPDRGALAGMAQPVPVTQEGESVTGVMTRMPVGGVPGSVMRDRTASALGVDNGVPVGTAPHGPVVWATGTPLPIVSPEQPPARPVNRLVRSQNDQLRLVPGSPTRIVIPAIAVDSPVVEVGLQTIYSGGSLVSQWETADYAVGFNRTSALPGKPGNTVMSGHNNINGEVFRYLSNVRAGDTISVFVGLSEFIYVVTQKLLLRESGVSAQQQQLNALWIAPMADERLTLVSCWPYSSNTQRLIVIAVPKPNATAGKP